MTITDSTGNETVNRIRVKVGDQFVTAQDVPTTFGAAMRSFNTLGALSSAASRFVDPQGDTSRFRLSENPEAIEGYEDNVSSFAFALTRGDVEAKKKQIDKEKLDRAVLDDSGAAGIVSMLAAGVLDPVNLIGFAALHKNIFASGAMGVRMGRIAEGSIQTAAADLVLQSQLELMTGEESVYAMAGTAFLAGIIPVAPFRRLRRAGAIARFEEAMEIPPNGDIADFKMQGAKAPPDEAYRIQELRGPFKAVLPLMKRLSAGLRVLTMSEDAQMRRLTTQLIDMGMNIPDAKGASVEALIRVDMGEATKSIIGMTRQYRKYIGDPNWDTEGLTRLSGKQAGTRSRRAITRAGTNTRERLGISTPDHAQLSYVEFAEEVGRALRNSDTQARMPGMPRIEEIDAAAASIRKHLNSINDRANASGLFDGRIKNYTPRVYNREAIIQNRDEFIRVLRDAFMSKHEGISLEHAQKQSTQAYRNIIDDPHWGAEYDGMDFRTSPESTKGRKVTIEDQLLDGSGGGTNFLIDNIEITMAGYNRHVIPELNFMERFGERAEALKSRMRDEALEVVEARNLDGEAAIKARNQVQRDIADVSTMIDRLANRYQLPGTPNGVSIGEARVFRALRDWNTSTKGGGFVISSWTDIARPVMVHGIRRVWGPMLSALGRGDSWKGIGKLSQVEQDMFGVGAEYFNAVSPFAVHDADAARIASKLERGLSNATTAVIGSTGFANWNLGMKHFVGHVTQGRLVDVAMRKAAGEVLSASDRFFLSRLNISDEIAEGFAKQFAKHGDTFDGSPMSNVGKWDDDAISREFIAAVRKDIDTVIVTPGIGDLPSGMQKEGLMRVLFQFKSFSMASMSRTVAVAAQSPDTSASLLGLGMMVAMGGIVYATKELGKNEEDRFKHTDPVSLAYEAIDRSGATGFLTDVHNTVQRLSMNRISIQSLLGSKGLATRATRPNVIGTLAGPSVDLMQSVGVAGFSLLDKAMTGSPLSEYEVGQLRRLLPGQNLWYMNQVFGAAEDAIFDMNMEEKK